MSQLAQFDCQLQLGRAMEKAQSLSSVSRAKDDARAVLARISRVDEYKTYFGECFRANHVSPVSERKFALFCVRLAAERLGPKIGLFVPQIMRWLCARLSDPEDDASYYAEAAKAVNFLAKAATEPPRPLRDVYGRASATGALEALLGEALGENGNEGEKSAKGAQSAHTRLLTRSGTSGGAEVVNDEAEAANNGTEILVEAVQKPAKMAQTRFAHTPALDGVLAPLVVLLQTGNCIAQQNAAQALAEALFVSPEAEIDEHAAELAEIALAEAEKKHDGVHYLLEVRLIEVLIVLYKKLGNKLKEQIDSGRIVGLVKFALRSRQYQLRVAGLKLAELALVQKLTDIDESSGLMALAEKARFDTNSLVRTQAKRVLELVGKPKKREVPKPKSSAKDFIAERRKELELERQR